MGVLACRIGYSDRWLWFRLLDGHHFFNAVSVAHFAFFVWVRLSFLSGRKTFASQWREKANAEPGFYAGILYRHCLCVSWTTYMGTLAYWHFQLVWPGRDKIAGQLKDAIN